MNKQAMAALPIGVAVLFMAGTVWAAMPAVVDAALAGHPTATCAPLPWTYQVGPRVMPLIVRRPGYTAIATAMPTPRPGRATSSIVAVWPGYILRGTMTVNAYTGCNTGSTTSGSFAVRRIPFGPPIERSEQGARVIPCAESGPCFRFVSGIVAATGTFKQDPRHAGDPTHVLVSATITSTRPGPAMGRPCSPSTGCPPSAIIQSTVRVNNVTGYLHVATGDQSATLSFLPPRGVYGTVPSTALVLAGWRAGVTPTPTP